MPSSRRVRKRDPRFAGQERFKDGVHGRQRPDGKPSPFSAADFFYDESRQTYRCPNNGKRVYARRLAIVEPVFANICVRKHMSRFTLRTKRKVDVQWRLFAMVHNIGKIHVFGAL
jgi:hypothetical protein